MCHLQHKLIGFYNPDEKCLQRGIQHKLIGFYNPDEKCLQRGTDWVFKSDSYSVAFRRLQDSYMIRLFKIAIVELCIKEIKT